MESSNKSNDLIDLMNATGSSDFSGTPPLAKSVQDSDSDFDSDEDGLLSEKVDLQATVSGSVKAEDVESDDDFDVLESSKVVSQNNPLAFFSASQDQDDRIDPAKTKPPINIKHEKGEDSDDNETAIKNTSDSKGLSQEKMDIVSDTVGLNALINELSVPTDSLVHVSQPSEENNERSNDIEQSSQTTEEPHSKKSIEVLKKTTESKKTNRKKSNKEPVLDSGDVKIETSPDQTKRSMRTRMKSTSPNPKEFKESHESEDEQGTVARPKRRAASLKQIDAEATVKKSRRKREEKTTNQESTKKAKVSETKTKPRTSKEKETLNKVTTSKPKKNNKKRVPSECKYRLVLSACDKDVVSQINQLDGTFSDIYILDEVDDMCTHLLLGDIRRTRKVLFAIALGKWILKPEWVNSRAKDGTWSDEKSYEIVDWLPGIKKSRLSHEQSEPPIFAGKKIFIGGQTKTDRKDIESLIGHCGGEIVSSYFQCDICISGKRLFTVVPLGDDEEIPDSPIVKEDWILDSISEWKVKDTTDYIATPKPSRKI